MRILPARRARVCAALSALVVAALSPMIAVPTASLMPPAAAVEKPPDGADGQQGADEPGNKVRIKLVGLGNLRGHYVETSGFNPKTEEYDLPKDPGLIGIECAVRGIREDFPNTLVVSPGAMSAPPPPPPPTESGGTKAARRGPCRQVQQRPLSGIVRSFRRQGAQSCSPTERALQSTAADAH